MDFCLRLTSCQLIDDFFRAGAEVFPARTTVCFENIRPCEAAVEIFHRHLSEDQYWPARDTISPASSLYYCFLTTGLVEELSELHQTVPSVEFVHHIRGYDGQRLIFYAHDICFDSEILLSPLLDREMLEKLATWARCNVREAEANIDWQTIQRKR